MTVHGTPARVILVEDDVDVARTTRRVLSGLRNVIVETCHDVATARRMIGRPFDVVVSDYHLPDGSGVDVLAVAARADINAPRIMITAHTEWDSATLAINFGSAFRILGKPLEPEMLTAAVVDALATKKRRDDDARQLAHERLAAKLEAMSDGECILRAVSSAIDRRLGRDAVRADTIASVGRALAEHLGLEKSVVAAIELTILAHRIGTIGLADDASAALVPLLGAEILSAAGFPSEITRAVAESGEQFVRCAWPDTSLGARILAISTRYVELMLQGGVVHEVACTELLRDESLDPVLVAVFVTQPESTWAVGPPRTVRCRAC